MGVMTIQVGAIESESNTRYTAPKAIDITTSPRMMAVITPQVQVLTSPASSGTLLSSMNRENL